MSFNTSVLSTKRIWLAVIGMLVTLHMCWKTYRLVVFDELIIGRHGRVSSPSILAVLAVVVACGGAIVLISRSLKRAHRKSQPPYGEESSYTAFSLIVPPTLALLALSLGMAAYFQHKLLS